MTHHTSTTRTKFVVNYTYWNSAGGTTHGRRHVDSKAELLPYLDLLLEDETIIHFTVDTDNPMMT